MDQHHRIGGSDFVWDADKAAANLRKHDIRFEDAATVFMDPFFVLTGASRNDEARDAVIGFDRSAQLLFVVHIMLEDGDCIRIISARAAGPAEEALYAQ
ncbi:MAG: BrnT family toxin [Rhodanobacteraceae bacterium]